MILQARPAAGRSKRGVPAWLLGAIVGVYILAVLNRTLWPEVREALTASQGLPGFWALSVTVYCRLIGNLVLTLALAMWPRVGKFSLALLIVVSAASAYYDQTFGARLNE